MQLKPATKFLLLSIFILLVQLSCKKSENLTFERISYSNSSCDACPNIRIEVPKALDRRKISEAVNTAIREEIITQLTFDSDIQAADIPTAMDSFNQAFAELESAFPEEAVPWEAKIEAELLFENEELLCIELNSYLFTGGAHGYGATRFLNFDKRKGTELSGTELFSNPGQFTSYAESVFRQQQKIPADKPINSTGFMFERDSFYLPENIGLTNDGLLLLFNPYEVASYADGPIELTLPYTEVDKYLFVNIKS